METSRSSSNGTDRIPVVLVTGFLGSGKTTLINAVLRDSAFAGTMVIVNEFGDVGLDHLLVSSAQDQVLLLDSGCLCCAASGSLRDTLIDLIARRASGTVARFERVIVETSGLANPGPLVASLLGDSALIPRFALSQVLTLVDACNGVDTLADYDEARRQIAFADRLLISKTDTASPEQIQDLRGVLAGMNSQAIAGEWQRDQPAIDLLVSVSAPGRSAEAGRPEAWLRRPLFAPFLNGAQKGPKPVHGSAFRQISTHVLRPATDTIAWVIYAHWTQAISARLGKRLLRCKGILPLGDDGSAWVVQGVQGYFASPERLEAWPDTEPQGFLVCIGNSITRAQLDTLTEPSPFVLSSSIQYQEPTSNHD